MSARALEFVENWVSQAIETMNLPPRGDGAQAAAMAAQCVKAASETGIPQSEIDAAFDDLAAFIGGQIEEARSRRADRSQEKHPGRLVDSDDGRVIDEQEDQAAKKRS
jgi:hypothetical protein